MELTVDGEYSSKAQVLLVVWGVLRAVMVLDIGVVGDFSTLANQFHRCELIVSFRK